MPIVLDPIASGDGSTWVTTAEADTYFATRHGIGTLWSRYDDSPEAKTALLVTAQQPIELSDAYTWPDDDEITQAMKDAVCEQAFFMLLDPDMEVRMALIAQGVEEAGLVMEKYRQSAKAEAPIAPRAKILLKPLKTAGSHEVPLVR